MQRAMRLALTTVLVACSAAPTAETLPAGAVPFSPPPWYARVYARLERCSGLSGDYHRVQWFRISGSEVPADADGRYAAVTYPVEHRIVIADFYAADTIVVEHEAMHDLSRTTGHPPQWFAGKCGDLMP